MLLHETARHKRQQRRLHTHLLNKSIGDVISMSGARCTSLVQQTNTPVVCTFLQRSTQLHKNTPARQQTNENDCDTSASNRRCAPPAS